MTSATDAISSPMSDTPPPAPPMSLETRVALIEKELVSIRRLVRLILVAVVATRFLGPETVAKISAAFGY